MESLPEYDSLLLEGFGSEEVPGNRSIDDFEESVWEPPLLINVFMQIFYGTIFLTGLCGNTLVIYVVVRFAKMQTVTK